MISTDDPNFAYAVFSSRVQKKEIEIERVTGSSVLLKINSVEKDDAGLYTCHTPNTDKEYYGNYGAETTLNGKMFIFLKEMMVIYLFVCNVLCIVYLYCM